MSLAAVVHKVILNSLSLFCLFNASSILPPRSTECMRQAGPTTLSSNQLKNEGMWEEMGYGDDFSVMDWMVK